MSHEPSQPIPGRRVGGLVVAGAGSATAASRLLLTGADIRNATLIGVDVRDGS